MTTVTFTRVGAQYSCTDHPLMYDVIRKIPQVARYKDPETSLWWIADTWAKSAAAELRSRGVAVVGISA